MTEITFDGFVGKTKTHGEATRTVTWHQEEVARLILEVEGGRASPDTDCHGSQHHVLGDAPEVQIAPTG
ncbi:MAG TPA: hypothetical protein VNT92_05180 [Acidimicrobiia bacterium]|nr:hypothetical protein [Acidimicrobiia bacterium]